jgi:hypothetical protein
MAYGTKNQACPEHPSTPKIHPPSEMSKQLSLGSVGGWKPREWSLLGGLQALADNSVKGGRNTASYTNR